jgi:hypothetical protein
MGYYTCSQPTGEHIDIQVTAPGSLILEDHWTTDIIYVLNTFAPKAISGWTNIDYLEVGDTIRVYESHPGVTFRNWRGDDMQGIINSGTGYCNITHMPPMDSFTEADSNGTILPWCAFKDFASGPIRHIEDGFDTSNIIQMGDHCFRSFCAGGGTTRTYVESLPVGSFCFDNLESTGGYVLQGFMANEPNLTSLPVGSFKFPKLTLVLEQFCGYFAYNTSLACIPYGSFNLPVIGAWGIGTYENLFRDARMRIDIGPYTTLTNTFNGPLAMYFWTGSETIGWNIDPQHYMSYHTCNLVIPDAFTITNATSVTPKWTVGGSPLLYSVDNGITWLNAASDSPISVPGINIKFVGEGRTRLFTALNDDNAWIITGNNVVLSGRLNTLLSYHHPMITTLGEYSYCDMFTGPQIVDASNLIIESTGFASHAFMFEGCTSLTGAPELPALTLGESCYNSMFKSCSSLEDAPVLPATNVSASCYKNMFTWCVELINAPLLPATTLGANCYENMFYECGKLEIPPALDSMNLATNCYDGMFYKCISLTTTPNLPATTLATGCYSDMFHYCNSLINAPELPANTLVTNCYYQMFDECTNLITAPNSNVYTTKSPIQTSMFYNCTALTTPLTYAQIPNGWK